MRRRVDLSPLQVAAVSKAVERGRLLMLLEVGRGKTAAALTSLLDLGAFPALVVAPAGVVATDVWGEEVARWEHLRQLRVQAVAGDPARRVRALKQPASVYVISYENLLWLTDYVQALHERFRALVYDEVDKMKTPGSRRFRRMRTRGQFFSVRLGLTGTPVGNHLLDLWGETFCTVGGGPLGSTFGGYRSRWFAPVDYYEHVWRLKCCHRCGSDGECKATPPWLGCKCHRDAVKEIGRRLSPDAFVAPASAPRTGVPPVVTVPRRLVMPPKLERVSEELTRQLWAELPSGAELEALAASTLAGKLRQLAGGAVYFKSDATMATDEPGWEEVHTAKLDDLGDLLGELQGEPLLVYYWFRHEAVRVKRVLKGLRWADYASDPAGSVRAWNEGRLDVLLAHPQSAGSGLNLQGGGHHVYWFAQPWSHRLWVQGNGRLARVGQKADRVTAHVPLCGPADERVASVLETKGRTEAQFMEDAR